MPFGGPSLGFLDSRYVEVAGDTMTGDLTLSGDPTNALHAATKQYVDALDVGANKALSNLASVAINTSLISDADSTDDLGSSTYYWKDLYIDKIYLNATATLDGATAGQITASGNLLPDTAATRYLGGGSNKWRRVYSVEGFTLSGVAAVVGLGKYGNEAALINQGFPALKFPATGPADMFYTWRPAYDSAYDLGDSTHYFDDCYFDKIFLNATATLDGSVAGVVGVDGFIAFPKASGNGIKVDLTTPTFGWRDLLGDVFARNTGASKPTFTTYRDTLLDYQFAAGDEEYFKFHIPHDYVKGTDIFLHIHWSHTGTFVTGGTITFTPETTYAKGHNQAAFPASVTGTYNGTASTTQYQHIISETQLSASSPTGLQIDTDDLEPDGVIIMRLEMTTNNITVSEGAVPDPFIHYVDIHYQSTNIGTKDKAPDFYA